MFKLSIVLGVTAAKCLVCINCGGCCSCTGQICDNGPPVITPPIDLEPPIGENPDEPFFPPGSFCADYFSETGIENGDYLKIYFDEDYLTSKCDDVFYKCGRRSKWLYDTTEVEKYE